MSNLNNERIEQYANDKRMCNVNDEIREMARRLLAAESELQEYRKASKEPVAWIIGEQEIKDFMRGYEAFIVRGDDVCTSEPSIKLYAAPPLQAVTVPDEQTWEELCIDNPEMTMGDAIIRAASWNACRAAMLCSGREKES